MKNGTVSFAKTSGEFAQSNPQSGAGGPPPGKNTVIPLTVQQAAALLKIHSVTLLGKARAGVIPGAKIGKCWVFVEIDLLDYIRSQYPRRALQGEHERNITCHSSNAKVQLGGGSNSQPAMDDAYSK